MAGQQSHYPPLGPSGSLRTSKHPYFTQSLGDDHLGNDLEDDLDDEIIYETPKTGTDRGNITRNQYDPAFNVQPNTQSGHQEDSTVGTRNRLTELDANRSDVDEDFQYQSGQDSPGSHQLSASPENSDDGGGRRPRRGGRRRASRLAAVASNGLDHRSMPFFGTRNRNPDAPPRGERKRGRARGRRGPRVADPGKEYQSIQTQATSAFMDERYQDAANLCLEAIQINPEMFASYSLISEIYDAWGKPRESHEALWDGAWLINDPEVWWKLAEAIMSYSDEDYGDNRRDRLMKCYQELIKKDPTDLNARRGRLELFIEQGRHNKAVQECEAMLGTNPYDLIALQCLAASAIEEHIASVAVSAYQRAIEHFQSLQPPEDLENESDSFFSLADLNDYIGLFMHLEQCDEGLKELKRLARWLNGREGEQYWDDYNRDDREWDEEDQPRRIAIHDFHMGLYPLESYGDGMPMELRAKLGLFRLKLGDIDEAMLHFELFAPEARDFDAPILEYPELFRDIGIELSEIRYHSQALRFFEALYDQQPAYRQPHISRRMAIAYSNLGQVEQATEYYELVVERLVGSTIDRIALARLYEQQDRRDDALEQVRFMLVRGDHKEVKESGLYTANLLNEIKAPVRRMYNRKSQLPPVDTELTESPVAELLEVVSRPTPGKKPQFRTLGYPQLRRLHERLTELSSAVRDDGSLSAIEEWMKIARVLVEQFERAQVMYTGSEPKPFASASDDTRKLGGGSFLKTTWPGLNPPDAQVNNDSSDQQIIRTREIQGEHGGVPFEEWLDVYCEYALLLAKQHKKDASYSILDKAEATKIFGCDDQCLQTIHVCRLGCQMAIGDEEKAVDGLRWWVKAYGHATDIWRVYNLIALVHPSEPNWYNAGPSQKYWMRVIKSHDYSLLTDKQRRINGYSAQERQAFTKTPILLEVDPTARPGNPQNLTAPDPAMLVFYAHLLTTNGSYPNALNYLLRAHAINPSSPLTLLSIATCYIQTAMKRVAENRHYSILQGMAFLREYQRKRLEGAAKMPERVRWQRRMECVYNEGRAWHLLGLAHLAVPKYERCLENASEVNVSEVDKTSGGGNTNDMNEVNRTTGTSEAVATNGPSETSESSPTNPSNPINTTTPNPYPDTDPDTAMPDAPPPSTPAPNPPPIPSEQQPQPAIDPTLRDEPDYTHEAAFALQQIYSLAGNMAEARRIGERWLVF